MGREEFPRKLYIIKQYNHGFGDPFIRFVGYENSDHVPIDEVNDLIAVYTLTSQHKGRRTIKLSPMELPAGGDPTENV